MKFVTWGQHIALLELILSSNNTTEYTNTVTVSSPQLCQIAQRSLTKRRSSVTVLTSTRLASIRTEFTPSRSALRRQKRCRDTVFPSQLTVIIWKYLSFHHFCSTRCGFHVFSKAWSETWIKVGWWVWMIAACCCGNINIESYKYSSHFGSGWGVKYLGQTVCGTSLCICVFSCPSWNEKVLFKDFEEVTNLLLKIE